MKEYQVVLIDRNQKKEIEILEPSFWAKANCLTDFCSPWKNDSFSKIEFRALWDLDYLYFNFQVFDSEIYIDRKDDSTESICNSDRVELFFRKDEKLCPYYCLEMDVDTRILDFEAYPNWNFDYNWKWPENQMEIQSVKEPNSFTVVGRISIASLKEFDLIQNNTIETGVYRAKFSQNEKGEYQPTWISWVNPNTAEPNFHIASSFGKFVLMK
ncbi:sugar-binding protein [Flavobacterium ginsenosidimutans]|uniref:sugar-binding protein n=1 Tax=Flavobacterium ginsenosidimutans TaxID=687844 RepID=UPI000DADF158|nr:sugar-binding protein [Flavobacterium ginsenosidimutans]KAF2331836.1 endoxylanase [Flavobacterium ginsenosidimutans]